MKNDVDVLRVQQQLARRLGQTEVKETPGTPAYAQFYDEGIWTPTYVGGTTAGATTYSVQEGNWTRIGRAVIARGRVVWLTATGTGQARISLPFTVSKTAAIAIWTDSVTIGATYTPYGLVQDGVAYLTLWTPANNAASTAIAVEAAGEVRFEATYFI